MTSKPASSKDPLENPGAAGSALSQDYSPRGGLFRQALAEDPEARDPGASATAGRAPWLGTEAGAVLERQLLLANVEAEDRPRRGWRRLRISLLALGLVALAAGAFIGFQQVEERRSREMGTLAGRIGNLEKQAGEHEQALARAREETALELAARKKENEALLALIEKTSRQLQDAFRELHELRAENEKLRLERWQTGGIRERDEFSVTEFLSRFCPPWLLTETRESGSSPARE